MTHLLSLSMWVGYLTRLSYRLGGVLFGKKCGVVHFEITERVQVSLDIRSVV